MSYKKGLRIQQKLNNTFQVTNRLVRKHLKINGKNDRHLHIMSDKSIDNNIIATGCSGCGFGVRISS